MRRQQTRLWLVCVLVLLASACASTSVLRRTAVASDALADATMAVQSQVISLHDAKQISDGDYTAWQRAFQRIGASGLALNQAIRQSDGKSATVQIEAVLDLIDELMRDDVLRVPADRRQEIEIALVTVRAVLISLSVAME